MLPGENIVIVSDESDRQRCEKISAYIYFLYVRRTRLQYSFCRPLNSKHMVFSLLNCRTPGILTVDRLIKHKDVQNYFPLYAMNSNFHIHEIIKSN